MPCPPPTHSFNFIIGAAKCGTTALFHAFKKHPAVHVGDVKEPHFFSWSSEYQKGLSHYLMRYDGWDPSRHRMTLDASATYTTWPKHDECARRIQEFNPEARLVYLVRNPVDRFRSHNQMTMASKDSVSANSDAEVAALYIQTSSYHSQLLQYRQYFRRDALLVISFDDLRTQPEIVSAKVARHWRISESEAPVILPAHPSRIFYSAYFIKKALIECGLSSGGSTTSQALKRFASLPADLQESISQKAEEYYTPSEQMQERIRLELSREMKMLQQEYGIDVSQWGF